MEAVRRCTHLGDRVNAGGGCVTAVTASTGCWFVHLGNRVNAGGGCVTAVTASTGCCFAHLGCRVNAGGGCVAAVTASTGCWFVHLGDRVNAGGGCETAVTASTGCWFVNIGDRVNAGGICETALTASTGCWFVNLGDRVNAGGRCETAVTAKTRCWWVELRECHQLLLGKMSFLRLRGAAYRSYVRPAILYGSEACCLKENKMRRKQYVECNSILERVMDTMLVFGFNDAIDQVVLVNSVCWYGYVLRRTLDFDVDGQRKKGRPKRTWNSLVEEKSMKVCLSWEDVL